MLRYYLVYIIHIIFIFILGTGLCRAGELHLFGYTSFLHQKINNQPELDSLGKTINLNSHSDWDISKFNLILQQSFDKNFSFYLNLTNNFEVNNVFGLYSLNRYYNFKLGKIYRKFGHFNHIREASPFNYGIEIPESFQSNHLILDINTVFEFSGKAKLFSNNLSYTANFSFIDNINNGFSFPFGFDLRYQKSNAYTFGTSFYYSGSEAISDIGFNEGISKNGVLPWMTNDEFTVLDIFLEYKYQNFTLVGEWINSNHNSLRNGENVFEMSVNKNDGRFLINEKQIDRLKINKSKGFEPSNIRQVVDYSIENYYVILTYNWVSKIGLVSPFIKAEKYSNPELIENINYGGDNEVGRTDDGKISKYVLGLSFYPINEIALKLAAGIDSYNYNDDLHNVYNYKLEFFYIFGN